MEAFSWVAYVYMPPVTGSLNTMYHWYVTDIEQTLDSIKEATAPARSVCGRECFLNGYKSEYPINDEMLYLLPAFRRFADLYSYTRILRASAEIWNNEPKWLADLRARLDIMMKRKLANLGDSL